MKVINIFILLFFSYLLIGCVASTSFKNDVNILVNKENIEFEFLKNKKVLIYHYEINDYENFEKDGLTYKRLYVSNEINKEMQKIILNNYKSKNLLDNHAYYILIGEQGLNKNGVGFTSIGFCLHYTKILTKQKNETTPIFIQKCHTFS